MAVPGLEFRLSKGSTKRTKIRWKSKNRRWTSVVGPRQELLRAEVGGPRSGLTGAVVGIQFEVAVMYTGTLIRDLIATVDRVGHKADEHLADELHEIFTMQIPVNENQTAFMGAA